MTSASSNPNPDRVPSAGRHTAISACILCSRNCGIELEIDGDHIRKVRGDERHPVSEGYLCQKAARLDHYQNNLDRLDSPLRRREDGSFEKVSWETAITEIAARIRSIRDTHGGRALAFYGGGGQGNHLGGVYAGSLVKAMRTRFHYSALAQEKTGDFWVNGKLFGRQTCHTTEDVEHADYVIFIGTNPWQAHGIRNARDTLRALSRDPARTMVVIDPRRTETAELADVHLQVRPGTDAFLMTAMLATIVNEGLEDREFLAARTVGFEELRAQLRSVPVDDYARRAGVDPEQLRDVARGFARAKKACVRVDLGLEQSLHSTLNSYLEKLLYLVTGHFGRQGCNTFHTFFLPLIGHSDEAGSGNHVWTTTVTGMPEISKLFPPNVLPAEIDNQHAGRIRGLVVDSANPVLSGADADAYQAAFSKLELLVVIDVAFTETARLAHYVLPASSQLEKWETTFFNLEFPTNAFHLRAPVFTPRAGTLTEPEIYRRLLVALGALPPDFPVLRAIARLDRKMPKLRLFPLAMAALLKAKPALAPFASHILRQTLGATLPDGAASAAVLWFAAHAYAKRHGAAVRRTGLSGGDADLGEALFQRILESRSGSLLSTHTHDDTWKFIRHEDRKIHLAIPEMLEELAALPTEGAGDDAFPFTLIAGERRSYNANTIFRSPAWRKEDVDGALRIHPQDAADLGLDDGALALCETARGSITVRVRCSDVMRRGVVGLPHGYGIDYPSDGDGGRAVHGPVLNRITSAEHRDRISATPFHKNVPARIRAVSQAPALAG